MVESATVPLGTKRDKLGSHGVFEDHSDAVGELTKGTFWATVACVMLMIGGGSVTGYTAVLLPQLEDPASPVIITTGVKSWIAGLAIVPHFLSNLITGYAIDHYGRRFVIMLTSIIYAAGWIMMGLANGIEVLSVGRFLTGYTQASINMIFSIFLGETISPKYRGIFLSSGVLAFTWGILSIHIVGTYIHWKITAFFWSLYGILSYIIFLHLPDTPTAYAKMGRIDKARRSFKFYRGGSYFGVQEFEKTIATIELSAMDKKKISVLQRLKKREYWKPLVLLSMYLIIAQMTGFNIIAFYTTYILRSTLNNKAIINEYTAMIIIDIARFITSCTVTFASRRVGRRALGLFSSFTTVLTLASLYVYLYLVQSRVIESSSATLMMLMTLYISASYAGTIQVPYMLMGEVFPTEIRGVASSMCSLVMCTTYFLTVTFVPYLMDNAGVEGIFLSCCCATFLGFVYLYFFLPETKDKTLLEIEKYFKDGSYQ